MNQERGYHSNKEVIKKKCWDCHGEHYGRTFQIIRFDEENFDHNKSGFKLVGSHVKLACKDCHTSKFISDVKLKKKENTFLGLSRSCNSCHEDVHQGTLDKNCQNCHNEDKFKPADKFSHNNTNFVLVGSHTQVGCNDCHKEEVKGEKKFRIFSGLKFTNCGDCHNDIHKGNFGNDCKSCHNNISFKKVNIPSTFDHSKTNFPLHGKHKITLCIKCHDKNLSNKPKFVNCYNCHDDYHRGEFDSSKKSDCKNCHNENSFTPSLYTVQRHNITNFKLTHAHSAIPCGSCHVIESKWKFNIHGEKCISCHENIHKDYVDKKYFDENYCESCHSTQRWDDVKFDHSNTEFELVGKHTTTSCRSCHFVYKNESLKSQKFSSLNSNCTECHFDTHLGQFIKEKEELCLQCHTNDNWNPDLFNHNNTRFILDGTHRNLACLKCHQKIVNGEQQYINYKIEDVSCKSCHS